MSRNPEKIKPVDIKYNAIAAGYNPRTATAMATVRHRERGRVRRRLNLAKFEARRTGDADLLIDAGVNELMGILREGAR